MRTDHEPLIFVKVTDRTVINLHEVSSIHGATSNGQPAARIVSTNGLETFVSIGVDEVMAKIQEAVRAVAGLG